jgi:hypothetical protein
MMAALNLAGRPARAARNFNHASGAPDGGRMSERLPNAGHTACEHDGHDGHGNKAVKLKKGYVFVYCVCKTVSYTYESSNRTCSKRCDCHCWSVVLETGFAGVKQQKAHTGETECRESSNRPSLAVSASSAIATKSLLLQQVRLPLLVCGAAKFSYHLVEQCTL